MDLSIIDSKKSVSVNDAIFGKEFNEGLVHQLVTRYLAGARQGSKAQKNRSDVSGGGAKPWRQKGTGRARAGTIRSPIMRAGGVTFAARPRDYSQKLNRKMYRAGMRSILSELVRHDRLKVMDDLALESPKTKLLHEKLKARDLANVLIVVAEENKNLSLAARNLPYVAVVTVSELNPASLVAFENVLIATAALQKIEENLA